MAADTSGLLRIEVVYALPDRQEMATLTLPAGSTVADAIDAAGFAALFPGTDLHRSPVGIWGRRVTADTPLQADDRVEIYRPLQSDPRDARRRLAAHGKAMGQHDDTGE